MQKMCCGCVNIRRGVVTIGIIGLIAAIIGLIIQFIALTSRKEIMKNDDDHLGNNLFSFIFIMGIVVCFFKLIADGLLIYGAVKQTTQEVSVWLIINLCTILYIFGTMVFTYMLLVGHESSVNHKSVCSFEIFLFFVNVIYIYSWHQVYMFSRQLYLDGRTSLEEILQNGYDTTTNA